MTKPLILVHIWFPEWLQVWHVNIRQKLHGLEVGRQLAGPWISSMYISFYQGWNYLFAVLLLHTFSPYLYKDI
jgi:hypothetical protein